MGLTVFLSNSKIQILSGSGTKNGAKLSSYYELAAPTGSILNGVVTDAAALTGVLKEFWKSKGLPKSGVRLIVNSQQFIVKMLEIPSRLPKNKAVDYVSREFSDVERTTSPVIGFYKVAANKAANTDIICAELADYDYLDNYKKLFLDAGITLSGISSAVGVAANMLQRMPYIATGTCVVLLLDGASLNSMLFVNGRYYYSSSTRLFSMHGTEAFGRDVSEVVNRLSQFMNAQHLQEKIASIYFGGFDEADLTSSAAGLHALDPSYTISELKQPQSITSSVNIAFPMIVYPTAGLYTAENEVNLISGLTRKTEKQKTTDERLKKALPFIILAGALLVVTLALFVVNVLRVRQLNSLNAQINSTNLQEAVASYDEQEAEAGSLQGQQKAVESLKSSIDSYPYPNSKVTEVIQDCAKDLASVTVTSYDASTGVLSVTATSLSGGTIDEQVLVINQFIAKLMKNSYFTNVTYTGYSYNDSTSLYDINVSCALSESAGKEAS